MRAAVGQGDPVVPEHRDGLADAAYWRASRGARRPVTAKRPRLPSVAI